MNCFHPYRTAGSLRSHERLCYDNEYCKINMPSLDNNILQYNSGEKSLKLEHINTYDLEALLIKHYRATNNSDRTYTEKVNTHEACGYAINLVREHGENKSVYYRGRDCMERFCEDINDMATKIILRKKKCTLKLMSK